MDETDRKIESKLNALRRRKRWRSLSADKDAWSFLYLGWSMALLSGISGSKAGQVLIVCLSLLAFCYGSYRLRNLLGRLDGLPEELSGGEYEPSMKDDWLLILLLVLALGTAAHVVNCVVTGKTLPDLEDDVAPLFEPRGG